MSKTQQPDSFDTPDQVRTGSDDRAPGAKDKGETRQTMPAAAPSKTSGKAPAAGSSWDSDGGVGAERRAEPRGKDKKKKK